MGSTPRLLVLRFPAGSNWAPTEPATPSSYRPANFVNRQETTVEPHSPRTRSVSGPGLTLTPARQRLARHPSTPRFTSPRVGISHTGGLLLSYMLRPHTGAFTSWGATNPERPRLVSRSRCGSGRASQARAPGSRGRRGLRRAPHMVAGLLSLHAAECRLGRAPHAEPTEQTPLLNSAMRILALKRARQRERLRAVIKAHWNCLRSHIHFHFHHVEFSCRISFY